LVSKNFKSNPLQKIMQKENINLLNNKRLFKAKTGVVNSNDSITTPLQVDKLNSQREEAYGEQKDEANEN